MAVNGDQILGVILAGGQARRMGGGDKGRLMLGGESLIGRVISRLSPQVTALVLNANGDPERFADLGLPVVPDDLPGHPGPLAGILAGMEAAARRGRSHVVSVAADTPFLPATLVADLAQAPGPIAMACAGGQRQPVCALWPVALRTDLRAALEAGAAKIVQWAAPHGISDVAFPEAAFFNINTAEDLAEARRLAQEGACGSRQ